MLCATDCPVFEIKAKINGRHKTTKIDRAGNCNVRFILMWPTVLTYIQHRMVLFFYTGIELQDVARLVESDLPIDSIISRCRSGAVVRVSDFGPRGPWFEPRPVHISLWP